MRRIVVNTKLIADAMLFTDAVQCDPGTGCIADVVMEIVARRPSGHGALFYAESEAAFFGLLQQGNELFLEVSEVLIHAVLLIATHKSANGLCAQQSRRVEDTQHE